VLFALASSLGYSLVMVLFAGFAGAPGRGGRATPVRGNPPSALSSQPAGARFHGLFGASAPISPVTLAEILNRGVLMWVDIAQSHAHGGVLGSLLGAAAGSWPWRKICWRRSCKAMLPGSQCGQCGYVGCAQAAAALARGEAPVTLCPPGGKATAENLAKRLGVAVGPVPA